MSIPKPAPYPELLSEEILRRVERLSPANLCDGMLGLGIPNDGCMEMAILPVSPEMKFCGTACTVDTEKGDNLPVHIALYTAPPGYVMVIDGKGCEEIPYFGDNMMTNGKIIGLKAMVVDGCVRDRQGCIELGFPVFCKGFIQRGPAKKNPGEINGSIACGGITVNPGDLVAGDADGVTVVPRDRIAEVLEKAEKKLEYDNERKKVFQAYEKQKCAGEPTIALPPKWADAILARFR